MFNVNMGLDIHNKFEFDLIGPDGQIKQKAYAQNIVLNSYWTAFFTSTVYPIGAGIQIGTGTGTLSPTRTTLFSPLEYRKSTTVSINYALPTSTKIVRATFEASSSLVGTITEVGLNNDLYTHALLQDAEGNPISIIKTDVDQLVVTATIYCTLTASAPLTLLSIDKNTLIRTILNSSTSWGATIGTTLNIVLVATNPEYLTDIKEYRDQNTRIWLTLNTRKTGTGNATTRTFTIAVDREPSISTYMNGLMLNYLYIPGVAYIALPNETIFPAYTTAKTTVGVGDGIKKVFDCPIPQIIPDTEEVWVNTVLQTRGVDYTIDPNSNSTLIGNPESNKSKLISPYNGDYFIYGFFGFSNWALAKSTESLGAALRPATPLVYEFAEPTTCNYLYISGLDRGTLDYGSTCAFKFSYSLDNVEWVDVVTIPSASYNSPMTVPPGGPLYTFEPVEAKYWRLSATGTSYGVRLAFRSESTIGTCVFGYKGAGITFTNPPAADASIVIRAMVNRPWKTADYVIDLSATITM